MRTTWRCRSAPFEAGSPRGPPSEESDPVRVPPGCPGPMITLSLGYGTNTSSARRLRFGGCLYAGGVRREILLRGCPPVREKRSRASRARAPAWPSCICLWACVGSSSCVMCRRRRKRACARVQGGFAGPRRLGWQTPCPVDARRVGRLVTRPQGGAGRRQAPARGLRSSRFTSQSAMSSAASW